jgi:hypothetical protein
MKMAANRIIDGTTISQHPDGNSLHALGLNRDCDSTEIDENALQLKKRSRQKSSESQLIEGCK